MLQTSMHVHPQMGWAIIIPTVLFVWPLPGLLRKLKLIYHFMNGGGAVVLPGLILMELMDNDVSGWGGW